MLNYLGYSWVDQGVNLDEAFKMLRRAVDLRPNDGYIVDSLGWAHYKLGHYQEATEALEKAIDLKPADPVVNDHLGDAYWRVNRRIEAHFQWNHARDMKPEPEDLPKILDKIEHGLPDVPTAAAPTPRPPPRARRRAAAARLGESLRRGCWRAPAKVNLTLHVLGRRTDGWHELDSVVAFAGCCDWLAFEPAETLSLTVDGPTAAAAGPTDDNLVLRAARALAERVPRLRLGRFHLLKVLPVAAGLGGGSSDAAAALRALAAANGLAPDDERLFAAAAAVGADVPVCLCPSARRMAGRGERLGPALRLPPLSAVLANPASRSRRPRCSPRSALRPARRSTRRPPRGSRPAQTRRGALEALKAGRNDLQASATRIAPAIGDTLDALARLDGARLVRMSGSGATCFALFDDRHAAARAARALARRPSRLVGARDLSQVAGKT